MNHRIAVGVVVLVLAAGTTSAQGRKTQVVTGASLASLGVYAAVMDRDCDIHAQTTLMNGQCEWRTPAGHLTGDLPELPREQLATGLTVAGIGGLMMAGAWEPSKGVDTLFTAGAGFLLLATAYDDNYPRGTVHERTSDGRTLTTCPTPEGSMGYDSDVAALADFCRRDSFSRIHMMWSGIAALGLAAGRALWRDDPPLNVSVRPGGVWVGKTIEF